MARALIQYRSYSFTASGRPWLGRKVKYEADAPGSAPRRALVTYTIAHVFTESSFAENQARLTALKTALRDTEGTLLVQDENGTTLVNATVRVDDLDLPAQWSQNLTEVTLTFTGYETVVNAGVDATYTPHGSSTPIVLAAVSGVKEAIDATRYSTAVNNRREAMGAVSMSGRIHATPSLTYSQRRSELQTAAETIRSIARSADGRLVFGAFDHVVRVSHVDADYHDGSDSVDWSIQADYREFPTGDYAEAEFTVDTKDDLEQARLTTTVKGKIRADDEAGARTKAAAIKTAYLSGRVLKSQQTEAQELSGADGDAFVELSFSYEFFGTSTAALSWTLSVSDKDDLKTGQLMTTYSGKVVGIDAAAVLAQARTLGDGKYPLRISATETVGNAAINSVAVVAVEVSFSYEYLRKGGKQWAEVNVESGAETYGTDSQVVSGFAVSTDETSALALAHSFLISGSKLLSKKETSEKVLGGAVPTGSNTAQFVKVTFNYAYEIAKAADTATIQYTVETSINRGSAESMVTYAGTCWADTVANADALINSTVGGSPGSAMTDRRTTGGDAGVLEASYAMDRTYSVDQAIITPIPYGDPVVQTGTGRTPGAVVATGSVTALSESQARTWARARIPSGGYPEPYREKSEFVFVKLSGSVIQVVRFDFTYSNKYTVLSMS